MLVRHGSPLPGLRNSEACCVDMNAWSYRGSQVMTAATQIAQSRGGRFTGRT
jgi:hypothetical protein